MRFSCDHSRFLPISGAMSRRNGKKNQYEVVDQYTKKAHSQGFVARSVFKLQEIDQKAQIYKGAKKVLDLGCSPGSWSQFAHNKLKPGEDNLVLGIDIEPVRVNLPHFQFMLGDLFEVSDLLERLEEFAPFDVVQSDAMTKTTGIAETDCLRSVGLVESAVYLSEQGLLKPGGVFLAKVFEGAGFTEFWTEFRKKFNKAKVFRPQAIRKGSREVYVYGILK